ncbi:serine protease [Paenibacillus sp. PAMC21692]|nr:serine protease [Paenibacillus sp. PAMC21692]
MISNVREGPDWKAELAGSDPDLDIAILKIDTGNLPLPFIELERGERR